MPKRYYYNKEGFSLVEVLVAIVILAAFVIPTCSSLVMSVRMNARAEALMQAQLDVSSAVETLMAEGIPAGTDSTGPEGDYGAAAAADRFPDVVIKLTKAEAAPCYTVTVTSNDELVTVTTTIREEGSGA